MEGKMLNNQVFFYSGNWDLYSEHLFDKKEGSPYALTSYYFPIPSLDFQKNQQAIAEKAGFEKNSIEKVDVINAAIFY